MEKKELIYGRNAVLEYLTTIRSGEPVSVYVSETAHGAIIDRILEEARRKGLPVVRADAQFFKTLGPSSKHQGAAISAPKKDKENNAESLLRRATECRGLIVLLDQLTDPHNVGSIIRSAEALGALGVVMTRAHSPGVTPTVVKSSAGATAHLDIVMVPNASEFMKRASAAGLWIIGTSDHGDATIEKARELKPAVLVIGSEGAGMRHLTEERCDCTVRIPLKGKVSSLNAAVAAGILIYELMKD